MTQHPSVRSTPIYMPADFTPTDADILCGRGKVFSKHPGNQTFAKAVRDNLQKYVDAPKRIDKSIVVSNLANELRSTGRRFMKQDRSNKRWYELSHDAAHEKVGHAIRDLLKNLESRELPVRPTSRKRQRSKCGLASSMGTPGATGRDFLPSTFLAASDKALGFDSSVFSLSSVDLKLGSSSNDIMPDPISSMTARGSLTLDWAMLAECLAPGDSEDDVILGPFKAATTNQDQGIFDELFSEGVCRSEDAPLPLTTSASSNAGLDPSEMEAMLQLL